MTRSEMDQLLGATLSREQATLDPPTLSDWDQLEQKFHCQFCSDFRNFIDLMSKYSFPGDIFNVSSGRTNGNDSIVMVYDLEQKSANWQENMIPFYGLGNGDYFCLNRDECPSSPVYYLHFDRDFPEQYSPSFDAWVRHLPEFLNG